MVRVRWDSAFNLRFERSRITSRYSIPRVHAFGAGRGERHISCKIASAVS